MTGLVFLLEPDSVALAMDSLSLSGDDKTPLKFCSKILPVPHLSGVVCGTGSLRLVLEWYADLQLNVVACDMDFVNSLATSRLREIAARLNEPTTSTVYHFGFSPAEGAFTGTAFRSTADFVPQPLEYGLGVKPPSCDVMAVAVDLIKERGPFDGMIAILERLRESDDALPREDRLGIGGEIHLMALNEINQFTIVVGSWPDFDVQFKEMLAGLGLDGPDERGEADHGGSRF